MPAVLSSGKETGAAGDETKFLLTTQSRNQWNSELRLIVPTARPLRVITTPRIETRQRNSKITRIGVSSSYEMTFGRMTLLSGCCQHSGEIIATIRSFSERKPASAPAASSTGVEEMPD